MQIIKLDTANAVFKGEGYLDVPATRYTYEDGDPGIEICLELSPEELAEINKTSRLYLYKLGNTLQPFFLSTTRKLDLSEGGTGDGN